MAVATTASYQSAKAVNDQSFCFDTWTTLVAGGPVSDAALAAAQDACARLQLSPQESENREKLKEASRRSLKKCSAATPRRIDPKLALRADCLIGP